MKKIIILLIGLILLSGCKQIHLFPNCGGTMQNSCEARQQCYENSDCYSNKCVEGNCIKKTNQTIKFSTEPIIQKGFRITCYNLSNYTQEIQCPLLFLEEQCKEIK